MSAGAASAGAPRRVLVTGAAGRIGRMLRPRLAGPGLVLRLLDVREQEPAGPGEPVEIVRAELGDADAVGRACAGVDAVVHLAALSGEDRWEEILRVNVEGTRTVLEAARLAGVPRVVLASSNHAVGCYRDDAAGSPVAGGVGGGVPAPHGPDGVPADAFPRPDGYYGWSKAAVEALGSLYADRYGMTVFALRIGACFDRPPGLRGLDTWLSPDDCARLVSACLTTGVTGFRVLWGVSANTRRWWSLAEAREIGYEPRDDAEAYAGTVRATEAERRTSGLLGGIFCDWPLGEPWVRRSTAG
ncbi:NAD-dependent epimerase/dehydratase family protein [Micromonospora coxensis]|uniref:NAD dependent epimerase/dehydratase family protein n=1 Tax=Micromonospora coxensis TaxID=356852 RepID=A0A1C5HWD9_9ACTN|nr:NAD(P)-dependent oxidoreductase [Micromonospora coxensis]SCG50272.1 NAD dependent epimerase/dehydratase family protein [Micromonospora coxensis]